MLRYGLLAVLLCSACAASSQAEKPLLLRQPTLSATHIVFSYAGDLWRVPREGGDAERLTTGPGIEANPCFSPDGTRIAFSGEYDGNVDVYVLPAEGGIPKRLTYHPGSDVVVGWTPDGERVLFRSSRNSHAGYSRLFTMSLKGGLPDQLPLPVADEGSFSPDGTRIAYVTTGPQPAWKRYRGGLTRPIWIARLSDSSIEKLPRDNSNDFNPLWVGSRIYFLSDRDGPVTLYAYDTRGGSVRRVLRNEGLDLKWACAGPGALVYEQFGAIHLMDLETHRARQVPIRVTGDLPELRPRFVKLAGQIQETGISPTGVRALLQARGDIYTVPADKGDPRNLTNTPGVMERGPAWSPDGRWIAYLSDESGEYELHLRQQNGQGRVRKLPLEPRGAYYSNLLWSPDSQKIAYTDSRAGLWCLDVASGKARKVDTNPYHFARFSPSWSKDSRWLAYTRHLPSGLSAVFLHSLESGESRPLTDGMADAAMPVFDRDGKHLYFVASTDMGPSMDSMASINREPTYSAYVVVLRKDLPSPLAPESDEEQVKEPEKKPDPGKPEDGKARPGDAGSESGKTAPEAPPESGSAGEPKTDGDRVRIDLDGIGYRVLSLPIPPRQYVWAGSGKPGFLLLAERPVAPPGAPRPLTLHKFDLGKRKLDRVTEGVETLSLSASGEKWLLRQSGRWSIQPVDGPRPGEGALKLDALEVRVDPQAEWRQMYDEVWRLEREFFYDPGLHGLDLPETRAKYAAWLDGVSSRRDLNYLFEEMLGELSAGHVFVSGGDQPEVRRVPGGLLGADFSLEDGRYRFQRILTGESWNPGLRAPLAQPGVDVKVGDYLLAVNGRELKAEDNLYSFFEATADRQVVLRVGPSPGGRDARDVTVVPVASETSLRYAAWVEDNRRKVEELSGGRLAYVYMPNTAASGYTSFNRYFFAQVGKEGLILDERFNGGGALADYVMDYLRRPLLSYVATRTGLPLVIPTGAIFGPKVMLINEWAGSGGDAMPWFFRKSGLGSLVGKRTWGGLIGMAGNPRLMDGGHVTCPSLAVYGLKGEWEVENVGVAPDIEVELDPAAWRQGRDAQLEKAVEVALDALRKDPLPKHPRPAYPNYHRRRAASAG